MDSPVDAGPSRPSRLLLAGIVLLGLLARGALLARDGFATTVALDDPDQYLPIARAIARGDGFAFDGRPTAYRPPLYPLSLAPLVALLGDRVRWGLAGWHLALGAGTILTTAAAARRWGLSTPRVLIAAAIVACDPVLVAQARPVMTETLAAFLTSATLAAVCRPGLAGAALGGGLLGLSALCRPSAWPWVWLSAVALVVRGQGPWRARWRESAVLLASGLLVAAPWAIRNASVFGEPIWTTTHGGYTLYLANNPVYYDEVVNGPPGAVWTGRNQWLWWDSVNRATRGAREPDADRQMRRDALRAIVARPGDFRRASLARLGRFWGIAPAGAVYAPALRIATAVWTIPLWLALVLGLADPAVWRWPRAAAPAVLLGLTAIHAVFWTDMRMRATIVPAIAVVAASATGPARKALRGLDSDPL